MTRQFTVDASNGAVYAYLLDRDPAGLKDSALRKLGGVELHQDPGSDSFAAYLIGRPGGQAVAVKQRTFDPALAWGDPDVNGTRPHGPYWFDGTNNYSLIGDRIRFQAREHWAHVGVLGAGFDIRLPVDVRGRAR